MIEVLIVAAVVLWSAVVVFNKVFPKTAYTTYSKLSQACQKRGWTQFARYLAPKMPAGCGGSCGCSPADKAPPKSQEIGTVKWK